MKLLTAKQKVIFGQGNVDASSLLTEAQRIEYYGNAHYISYYFVGTAMVSALALIIYGRVVRRIDAKKNLV